MPIYQQNNRQFHSSTIINAQDELEPIEHLSQSDIDEDLSVDSCPAELPNEGSRYDISKHHSAAIEQKKLNIEKGKELKQDWLDAEHWRSLASGRGYVLPQSHIPLTSEGIERVLHDLNLDQKFFRKCFGARLTYQEFVDLNPKAPLWAFSGWVLEQLEN